MYENMTGYVCNAIQYDRMLRTVIDARVAEAVAAQKSQSVAARGRTIREPIAKMLIALAARLTSTTQTSPTTSNV
jgi:hypothetical protein